MKKTRIIAAVAVGVLAVGALAACDDMNPPTQTRNDQLKASQKKFDNRTPPNVTGDAEYQNYINAQEKVYDDPANILWCTAAFPNATSPIFTVPIAGKLTSSTVSYYPSESAHYFGSGDYGGELLTENQSVDGMYHGTPVAYRYGFTPGGQYVDFTGLSVFCTTALTKFQRQSLDIAQVDDTVTSKAEAQLKAGDKSGAQKTVDGAATK